MPYYKVSFAITSVEIVTKVVEASSGAEAEDKAIVLLNADGYCDYAEVELDYIEVTDEKPYVKPDPNQTLLNWDLASE